MPLQFLQGGSLGQQRTDDGTERQRQEEENSQAHGREILVEAGEEALFVLHVFYCLSGELNYRARQSI